MAATSGGAPSEQELSVLMIEDNPTDVLLLKSDLSIESGVRLTLTSAGLLQGGIDLLRIRSFDLILLDLDLPDSHGTETFDRVREAAPDIPVIVYSGAFDDQIARHVLQRWAQDYVTTPASRGSLVAHAIRFAVGRHRRALELQQSERQVQQVIRASVDAMVVVDAAGLIRFANPAAEELFDQPLDSLLDSKFAFPAIPGKTLEVDCPRRTGEIRTAEMRVSELSWQGHSASLASLRDITERNKAQAEIRALNSTLEERVVLRTRALEEANQELEAFAYSVSHDLRAPLRHVRGFTELLQQQIGERLKPSEGVLLSKILSASIRMQALIADLLAFSRLGRGSLRRVQIAMQPLVNEILGEMEPELPGRPICWRIDSVPDVDADRSLFKQVLVNLISNAVKFTRGRDPAKIEIGCRAPLDGQVTVFVRDNGAGFDMENADRLFGVFQRLHKAEDFEGTGIGLAVVQRILHRHGGRIWAESTPGAGATFFFTIHIAGALPSKAEMRLTE
jgi:signal transduction histidine kinase